MKVRFEPDAEHELLAATAFVGERSERAAENFLSEIDDAKRQLLQFPRSGSPIGRGVRRCLLKRFPYQLIYRVKDDEIVIYAVAHHKRRPRYWSKRLRP